MRKIVSIVLIFSVFPIYSLAKEPIETLFFRPKKAINLRSAPPSGIFNRYGEIVGEVGPDQAVTVKMAPAEEKKVLTLFGSYIWRKVHLVGSGTESIASSGWVYFGDVDGVENFLRVLATDSENLDKDKPEGDQH